MAHIYSFSSYYHEIQDRRIIDSTKMLSPMVQPFVSSLMTLSLQRDTDPVVDAFTDYVCSRYVDVARRSLMTFCPDSY